MLGLSANQTAAAGATLVLAGWLLPMGPAWGQGEADRTALLQRIQTLERRLEQLERGRGATARRAEVPRTAPVAASVASPPVPDRPPPSTRLRDPHDVETPQEAFVFRDQAVTLRPGRGELSLDLGYLRDRRTVSADRSASAVLSARLGIADGIEASITAPFFVSTRTFELAPNLVTDRETRGIGDVAVQVNFRGWGEREYWPGAVFTAALVTPTGPSPFISPILGLNAQQVPVDATQLISARGAWALRGGVQMFKTVDPLVIFGGVTFEHVFPVEQGGLTFRPGRRIGYNAGFSFALSERSTLGFTFIGSYTSALKAERFRYRATAVETGALRISLIQRLAPSLWLEPSLALGLVTESPAFQAGLGLRYRF